MASSNINPLNSEFRTISLDNSISTLSNGMLLRKVRYKGRIRGFCLYLRKYKLCDSSELVISYNGHKKFGTFSIPFKQEKSIPLGDIVEVRTGHATDTFNKFNNKSEGHSEHFIDASSNRCFSLILKNQRTLDLIAEEDDKRNLWVDTLSYIIASRASDKKTIDYKSYLLKLFQDIDKNGDGNITFNEFRILVKQLHLPMNEWKIFQAVTRNSVVDGENVMSVQTFKNFYHAYLLPKTRKGLEDIFNSYSNGYVNLHNPNEREQHSFPFQESQVRMTAPNLHSFLEQEQKVELTMKECRELIKDFEPDDNDEAFSLKGFVHFIMFSDIHEIVNPAKCKQVYQDMNRPLSHYWIASSHNTYLVSDQVIGKSSIEGYVEALKSGCRCIELDCWDGEDEPIIYHGYTLTSKLLFKDVVKAIKEYAFCRSEYPLILSVENHCSVEYQNKMASHLVNILGEALFTEPVDMNKHELPSPEFFRNKILIKTKKLQKSFETTEQERNQTIRHNENEKNKDETDIKRKTKSNEISPALSKLINYIEAISFPGFGNDGYFYQMSSFKESKVSDFCRDEGLATKFVDYNSRHLSRIYPGKKRQDSSNFNPVMAWNAGCQMVALNYQTDDASTFVNESKFIDNGGCGYVLKPDFLTQPHPAYSPSSTFVCLAEKRIVEVTVISGQHIPKSDSQPRKSIPRHSCKLDDQEDVLNSFVKVEILGHSSETKTTEQTETSKGMNPVWSQAKPFEFSIKLFSLAFIKFSVKHKPEDRKEVDLGMFCAPLQMIQPGFRRINLKSGIRNKDISPASLLVRIEFFD